MSTIRYISLASVAALLPAQQSTRLAGPTSGLMFDAPSRAIRVVMGVPGAAYLGASVVSEIDNGSVAPDGRFAVGIGGGEVRLFRVSDSSVIALGDGCEGTVLSWAADGSSIALACGDGVRLYRVSGSAPQRLGLVEFTSAAKALAVDSATGAVYAAASDGIYRIDGESARLLAPIAEAQSLALSGGTLFAADRAGKQVVALDNLAASASLRSVVGEGQGIADPVAVGVSADGTRLYIAEGEPKILNIFNPATAELLSRLELDFAPTRVDTIGSSLFLLKSRAESTDTVQVLDARQLSVYFIPAQDLSSVAKLED